MMLLRWSSTAFWRKGVPERVATAVFGFPQGGEFPREQPDWFLLRWYSTGTQSISENRFFFRPYYRDMQSTTWVLISSCLAHFIYRRAKSNTQGAKTALREILLLEEIQG
jgi:hypothetical protein